MACSIGALRQTSASAIGASQPASRSKYRPLDWDEAPMGSRPSLPNRPSPWRPSPWPLDPARGRRSGNFRMPWRGGRTNDVGGKGFVLGATRLTHLLHFGEFSRFGTWITRGFPLSAYSIDVRDNTSCYFWIALLFVRYQRLPPFSGNTTLPLLTSSPEMPRTSPSGGAVLLRPYSRVKSGRHGTMSKF